MAMSFLNQAQIAALQQMGICVWQRANNFDLPAQMGGSDNKAVTSVTADTQVADETRASVDNATSQARVAQLRESLNAMPESTDGREPVPLTAQQQKQHAAFLTDLKLAWKGCHPSKPFPAVHIGAALSVSSTTIVLPVMPEALSAKQKSMLWKLLWQ